MNFRFEDEEQNKAKGKLLISHSSHTTIELNNISIENSGNSSSCVEKEHMFDKVVTPSDVGKLNRLVIPKQHAEKYFPLDLSTNEKGLVLNFEDNKNGKQWRFRYSYWYSSQSYVMTKGWTRFVKEKKLQAGDIVSFQRVIGQSGKDCLYIDWRRPSEAPHPHNFSWSPNLLIRPQILSATTLMSREQHWLLPQQLNYEVNPYYYVSQNSCSYGNVVRSTPVVYFRSAAQRVLKNGGGREPPVFEPVPVVEGKAAAKRLRLFGVNMDCPVTTETDDQDNCEVLSSTTMSYAPLISNPLQLSSSSSQSPVAADIRRYSGMPLLGMPSSHQQHNHDKGKSTNSIPFDFDT